MDNVWVNLVSGAAGALLGAFAAYRLQVRESQKLGKGAARAVYLELTTNLATLKNAANSTSVNLLGAYTRDTWTAEQARLASFVPADVLMQISYAYALFPDGQRALEIIRGGIQGGYPAQWRMIRHVATAVADAAVSLKPLVWSSGDQKKLDKLVADNDAAPRQS